MAIKTNYIYFKYPPFEKPQTTVWYNNEETLAKPNGIKYPSLKVKSQRTKHRYFMKIDLNLKWTKISREIFRLGWLKPNTSPQPLVKMK